MKKILAINGGKPVLNKPLPYPNTYGKEEMEAVKRVIKSGVLSGFVAAYNEYFLGGKEVKKFEEAFCKKFKIQYAVSCNSATAALHMAIIALKIGPGDEVIVPPYTMSATVAAILMNGAIPVFADIDANSFCIDPESIKERISPRTKAIMVVNLFGGPADFDEILKIAKEHNLKIIEDNAQSPGGQYRGKYTGTIGDIGIFSFNFHKVIQCGEGGVLVTNNKEYAFRAQLARNHAEAVIDQVPDPKDTIILGNNYRMSELHAAIVHEQLKKLDFLNRKRIELVEYLSKKLKKYKGIEIPAYPDFIKHVYYEFPMKIHKNELGISRDQFIDAMKAEGFPMSRGYCKPIYLLPVFQNKKVFNDSHFPFEGKYFDDKITYDKGLCPVCERMYEKEFTFTNICQYPYTKKEMDLFVKAVDKVISNMSELL